MELNSFKSTSVVPHGRAVTLRTDCRSLMKGGQVQIDIVDIVLVLIEHQLNIPHEKMLEKRSPIMWWLLETLDTSRRGSDSKLFVNLKPKK